MNLEERVKELEIKVEVIIKSVDKLIEIQNARVELDKINKLESARASLRIKKIRDQNEDEQEIMYNEWIKRQKETDELMDKLKENLK